MPNSDYIVQSDPNFTNELVTSGFQTPTNLITLPDGKMLVLEKRGVIKILDPQVDEPSKSNYLRLSKVTSTKERGLLAITLDPNFDTNKYFYVYYNYDDNNNSKNAGRFRVSRFKHNGTNANLSDEKVIWEANEDILDCCHFGGALSFGPDGYLYLATGDVFTNTQVSQDLTHSSGKIVRLDASAVDGPGGEWRRGRNNDHLIPDDNPFVDDPSGILPEIWASGVRNPFSGGWDLPSGRFFLADVGGNVQETAQEEINVFTVKDAGANFGWPNVEGVSNNPAYKNPAFSYGHTEPTPNGAAVISGLVYRGNHLPSQFSGAYFFADYVQGWLRYFNLDEAGNFIDADPSTPELDAHNFDNSIGGLTALKQGPEGALYYTDFFGNLRRIRYDAGDNLAPFITEVSAENIAGPLTVKFTGSATDPENDPLEYLWNFGDGTTGTGVSVEHTYNTTGLYEATLEVSDPTNKTTSAPIRVMLGSAPEATIQTPFNNELFRAGDTINLVGTATDDGPLTDNSYQWDVRFIHNAHFHPEIEAQQGATFSFQIDTTGHDFSDATGFEISLTVTDSDGLTDTETVSIFPDKVDISFESNLSDGITYTLDGVPRNGPFVHDAAINFEHTISAPQTVAEGGVLYTFDRWSNGVTTSAQTITVPDQDEEFKALYVPSGRAPRVDEGLQVLYTFDAGSGNKVFDVSGTGTPLNLTIQDPNNVTWGNGTLTVDDPTLISSLVPAKKVSNAVQASNELTIEAWVQSADINQNGPARIVTLSQNGGNRNFTLGQGDSQSLTGDFSTVRLRTTNTDNNGLPAVLGQGFSTDLTHVVYTREADGDAHIYHDGVLIKSEKVGGNLSNWNTNYQLALANELNVDRAWLGAFDLVAIYDQALSAAEVLQNYNADADDDGDEDGPDEPPNNLPRAVPDSVPAQQDMPLVITSEALLSNDDLGDAPSTLTITDINSEQGGTIVKNDNDT
ncbi:MAG: PQQ-dependent sugar dehydrogenase, partial [Cyanobacteria bacterium P01_F01_bin.53]